MKKLLFIVLAAFMMSPMANAKQVGKVELPDSLVAGKNELISEQFIVFFNKSLSTDT
jgi:hypothetical protein